MLRDRPFLPFSVFVQCPYCNGGNGVIYQGPPLTYLEEVINCQHTQCSKRFFVEIRWNCSVKGKKMEEVNC